MKTATLLFLLLATVKSESQGTFIYDQQSSTDETTLAFGSGVTIQTAVPYGQSFQPSTSSIDFIRLKLNDKNPATGSGATLLVQLHEGSLGGVIIGSTAPVTLGNSFSGTVNFVFPTTVLLNPGSTYVFEPVVQTGELWNLEANEFNYAGGMAFYQGLALPGSDFWFREGIIVPEPSAAALMLMGVSCFTIILKRGRGHSHGASTEGSALRSIH